MPDTSGGKIYDYGNHSGSRKELALILIDLTVVCLKMFLRSTSYIAVSLNFVGDSLRIALLLEFQEFAVWLDFEAYFVGEIWRLNNVNKGACQIALKSHLVNFSLLDFCTSPIGDETFLLPLIRMSKK